MTKRYNAGKASLDLLRSMGYAADIVERRNRFGSLDYLGFADIVGICPNGPPIAVQATTGAHLAHRLTKMRGIKGPRLWLDAGGVIFIHGWGKKKRKRGGKAFKWECRRMFQVTIAVLDGTEIPSLSPQPSKSAVNATAGVDRQGEGPR